MSKGQLNLQDTFLNLLRKDKTPVTVYLVNGLQIKGILRCFDNFTVIIEMDQKQQLIYKHAISTVAPIRPVGLFNLDFRAEDEPSA